MTLNLIQALYERKYTTYPRVDTQYLSDDIYPKCPQTLNGLFQTKFFGKAPYADLIRPIGGKALKKSKRVFDSSKVTDHHAIIPTGVVPQGLSDAERKVFDLIARRFIGVFLPDCKFSTTTVLGEVSSEDSRDSRDSRFSTQAGASSERKRWRVQGIRGVWRVQEIQGVWRVRKLPRTPTSLSTRSVRCPPSPRERVDRTPPPSRRNGPHHHPTIPRPLCCARWRRRVSLWRMRPSVLQ